MPTNQFRVTIEEIGGGRTRMSINSIFPSTEAMEQLLAWAWRRASPQAVGQIDAILAEDVVRAGEIARREERDDDNHDD